MIFCTEFNDLKSDLFDKLGILTNYQGLRPTSLERINLLNKLFNPQNGDNVKFINAYFSSALLL